MVFLIREMICLQHFHNIFTTNPKWKVVTGCYCWGRKVILVFVGAQEFLPLALALA